MEIEKNVDHHSDNFNYLFEIRPISIIYYLRDQYRDSFCRYKHGRA